MKNYETFRQSIGLANIGNQRLPDAPFANPFKRGSRAWNLSAQMEIMRRDPALASRLKALAEE